jgi:hypothetical protein
MTASSTPSANTLVKKLAQVMKEVSKIPKNGKNSFHNYKYVMESDLVEAVRDKLAERHIFITSCTKGIEVVELSKPNKNGDILPQKIGVLRVDYTFHDGESGETLTMESIGEIDQDGGKGLYKALTGSMKYFLMKNFLVATGDDPEKDEPVAKTPKAPKSNELQPATPDQLATLQSLATELGAFWDKTKPISWIAARDMIAQMEGKKKQLSKELDAAANSPSDK